VRLKPGAAGWEFDFVESGFDHQVSVMQANWRSHLLFRSARPGSSRRMLTSTTIDLPVRASAWTIAAES